MAREWQEINAPGQSCHWWRDLSYPIITAMTEVIVLLALAVLLATALSLTLLQLVGSDGYGHRPAPRSREDDDPTGRTGYAAATRPRVST